MAKAEQIPKSKWVNLKEMGTGLQEFKSLTCRAGKCCLGMAIGDLHESYFKGLGFESGKKNSPLEAKERQI